MYRVLIADEDVLGREALKMILSRNQDVCVTHTVSSGEDAVRVCKEEPMDIVFLSMQVSGIKGVEASRVIHRSRPETAIYILTPYATGSLVHRVAQDVVEDVLEKPVTHTQIQKVLEDYAAKHANSVHKQLELLTAILKEKDFKHFSDELPTVLEDIYREANGDANQLMQMFTYLGQGLLDSRGACGTPTKIQDVFPIHMSSITDPRVTEIWLFGLVDKLFCENSVTRYPLLENIFTYISDHIQEDITLNSIVEHCAISQGYLSRIFRERFHVSVTEYIHMRKIHLAKRYFCFTEYSIAEVAFRLGYNESSYFSKIFKKYGNSTAKEYRQKTAVVPKNEAAVSV